jgi:hypothetical protein
MKKLFVQPFLLLLFLTASAQSTPELEAADVISVSLPLATINQTCDVYKTQSINNSNNKFIHTPYFAFRKTSDGKLDVQINKVNATKSAIVLTLLCSPQELKKSIADYIRIDAIKRNKTELININEKDIVTPNFISLKIEDITPETDFRFPENNNTGNIYVVSIPITIVINTTDVSNLVTELQNGKRVPQFKITYTLNAKFLQSSSQVKADVANLYNSTALQDLKGASGAFSWAANYPAGSVTKAATTVTRNQKQTFEGRIKNEISVAYDIENPDDLKFLQEQMDKFGKDIFKKATIDLTKGDFAQELARLSSYGFAKQDIEPDRIDTFFSKIKDYFLDEHQNELDASLKTGGSAYFGMFSGDLDTKVTKNDYAKQLRDNGWEIEQKGNIYIPKSLEVWMLNETSLNQNASIRVRINKSKRDAFQQTLVITTKENNYFPELQNFATFYETFLLNSCPVGAILPFGGTKENIPNGWQLCDGKLLDTLNYKELFVVIGYNWGKGLNGTFNVPDLRGEFLRGVTYNSEKDPDVNKRNENGEGQKNSVGSYQEDAFANHTHPIKRGSPGDNAGLLAGNVSPLLGGTYPTELSTSGGSETRPKNAYVNYIIRIK